MPGQVFLRLLRLITVAIAVVVTESFQSKGDLQKSLPDNYTWRLYAIENNDKGNLTPAQRALQQTIRKEKSISEFDRFKRTVYSGVDSIQSLAKGKTAKENKVIDGYSERKAAVLNKVGPSTTVSLFSDKVEKEINKSSPFDQVKSALYGTLDLAGKVVTNKSEGSNNPRTRVDSLPVISISQANSNGSLLSPQLLAELEPDLQSGNLLKRWIAQAKLTQLEGKERIRLQKSETQKKIQEAKEFVYTVLDGIKSFVDFVLTIPGEAQKAADSTARFAASIPGTIEDAVETVQSIPGKAKETVDDIQSKVDNTVATTKQIVADVRDLPNKVQRKADETKQNIAKAVETVNDGATSVKVLVGLEKPKPKPPSTPPPSPPKASDVAMKVVGFALKTTGKATWWLGKTVVSAAYNAVLKSFETDKKGNGKGTASQPAKQGEVTLESKKEPEEKRGVEQQAKAMKPDKQTPLKTPQKPNPPSMPISAKTKPTPPPSPPKSQRETPDSIEKSPLEVPPSPPASQQDIPENTKSASKRRESYKSSLDEEVRNALQQAADALEAAERFKGGKEKKEGWMSCLANKLFITLVFLLFERKTIYSLRS